MFPNCMVEWGGAGLVLKQGTQCHMAGHSSTAPRKAGGPEVATGRCTLALSQKRGSERE